MTAGLTSRFAQQLAARAGPQATPSMTSWTPRDPEAKDPQDERRRQGSLANPGQPITVESVAMRSPRTEQLPLKEAVVD